jgi:riboflavin kinase/FMN adenylyltransferase
MRPMQAITGTVLEGEKRGVKLGFPTANIALTDGSLSGIYAGTVTSDGRMHHAALYADQKRGLLEAHLLDFRGDLYGKMITVAIDEKIRDDRRFDSEIELKAAIADDIVRIREYFKNKQK